MDQSKITSFLKDAFRSWLGFEVSHGLSSQDYSFGQKEAILIKREVKKGNYRVAHTRLNALSSDDLRHTLDCLAFNLKEEVLLKWYNDTDQSMLATLTMGIFHGHKGWIIRGHSRGEDVSHEDAMNFIEHERKSALLLHEVEKPKNLAIEAYARLIKVYMSISQPAEASMYFRKCIELDPHNLWAYIHRAESIQPKWGGSNEAVVDLLNNLPDRRLIQQIVKMKFAREVTLPYGINLVDDKLTPEEEVKGLLRQIDQELKERPEKSIHRFMLYAYIAVNGEEVGDLDLAKKYASKMEDNYPLYPFGMQP